MKKLNLHRETLAALSSEALDQAQGGVRIALPSRVCMPTMRILECAGETVIFDVCIPQATLGTGSFGF